MSRSGDLDLQRGSCGPVARGPVPRDRRGGARQASVVRDRQIANRSIDIKVLRTFSPCDSRASIDIKVLTDLKASFPNPDNLENLENPAPNPAHILLILKILLLI